MVIAAIVFLIIGLVSAQLAGDAFGHHELGDGISWSALTYFYATLAAVLFTRWMRNETLPANDDDTASE